jgi:hypothetical protein
MKSNLLYGILFPGLFFILPQASRALNAPVTTAGTIANAIPGSQITVPVTVTGFTNVGSVSLALDYNYSKMHFVSGTKNPLLAGNFSIADNDLGNGTHRILAGWYGSGSNLPNGTWLINIVFSYIGGTSQLQWFDNGPSCAYTDANANNLNDLPTTAYYINGLVCGAISSPGTITGSASVCQGQANVSYSIAPIPNVSGYNWLVPQGSTIISGSGTNAIAVSYAPTAASGNISVNGVNECGTGPSSQLPVTVNALPVANAGNDTTIPHGTSTQLHAAPGGTGAFSYHWSPESLLVNPNVQNPQTVVLTTSTLFQLVVTSQPTLCQNMDEKIVTVTGGPLNNNPVAVPSSICHGENAQLFANTGGGSGSYTCSWTCTPPGSPPWTSNQPNPVVVPDSTTHYFLSVFDGYTYSTGSVVLSVQPLPTATVSGGDTLCGDGSIATIRVDLTGIPPWTFVYSDGLNTTTISGQMTTPYFIYTSVPGNYLVLSVQDAYCSGPSYGYATVTWIPVPTAPEISLNGNTLISTAPAGNQWYLDMVAIPGANGQTYYATQNGSYFAIATLNGCSSDTSNILDVVVTGTGSMALNPVAIYPNPAQASFRLRFGQTIREDVTVKICSVSGTLLKELGINAGAGLNEYLVDISNLPAGAYVLMIDYDNCLTTKKLFIF